MAAALAPFCPRQAPAGRQQDLSPACPRALPPPAPGRTSRTVQARCNLFCGAHPALKGLELTVWVNLKPTRVLLCMLLGQTSPSSACRGLPAQFLHRRVWKLGCTPALTGRDFFLRAAFKRSRSKSRGISPPTPTRAAR